MLAEEGSTGRLPFIDVDRLDTARARVVFQGAEGSYSQAAVRRFFGEDVNSYHVETFRDAMAAIEEGSADYAVLPIENSTALSVRSMICSWNLKTISSVSRSYRLNTV